MNNAEEKPGHLLQLFFLSKYKSEKCVELVNEIIDSFKYISWKMSITVHYLHRHMASFHQNFGDTSEEQGGRFHQDIKTM